MKTLAERLASKKPAWPVAVVRSLLPVLVGFGIAFLLQAVVVPAIGPFYGKLLMDCGITIVLAVSLNMVNGFAGQFSIGHAGFMAIGGYLAAALTFYLSYQYWGSAEVHGGFLGSGDMLFVAACLAGGLLAAGAGFLVGLPSLRLRGDYLAIVTLGFGEIVRVFLQNTDNVVRKPDKIAAALEEGGVVSLLDNLGGSLGFHGVPKYSTVFWVYVFVALVLITSYRLKSSHQGRALLAVRENEIAAEAIGVNTTRAKVSAFVLSAFFAGVGGALFAHQLGTTINPGELGFAKSIDIVIIVVLGGMGSISGAALAAVFLTILPEVLREFAEYRMIVYALLLIGVMILRPKGLFGI
jgi:branched-chain amino acid transport system permease protein